MDTITLGRKLLISLAKHKKTVTYPRFAKALQIDSAELLFYILATIDQECQERGEPFLTSLVTMPDGSPPIHFKQPDEWKQMLEELRRVCFPN